MKEKRKEKRKKIERTSECSSDRVGIFSLSPWTSISQDLIYISISSSSFSTSFSTSYIASYIAVPVFCRHSYSKYLHYSVGTATWNLYLECVLSLTILMLLDNKSSSNKKEKNSNSNKKNYNFCCLFFPGKKKYWKKNKRGNAGKTANDVFHVLKFYW